MQKPAYLKFMLREATAFGLAGYLIYLLVWFDRLGSGPEAYAAMIKASRSPQVIVLHLLVLGAALYHSITWFNLTPQIMPLYRGEDRIPDGLTAVATGYLPWVIASAVILWSALTSGGGT
jgi:fumarate reductase subunit C